MVPIDNELAIRTGFFLGVFAIMAVWELLAPRRALTTPKSMRWFSNLSIVFLNSFLIRLMFPVLAIETALIASQRGWGVFNNVNLPVVAEVLLGIMALDFIIYIQHVLFHILPLLWSMHKMHHADMDIDVTTGSRFHPFEIFISMGIKVASIALLGASAWAVLIFEVLLNATAMFNHSNVYIPLGIDRYVRLLVVTPDMHRVHHSVIIKETNSNYGFNLPWWDRIFGTYRAQPVMGHTGMNIGLANFRDPKKLTLPYLMAIPFVKKER
jgi:sterol desaturase/sphingolipid hydroxylase (fatty acid hydroxylase superfamily)